MSELITDLTQTFPLELLTTLLLKMHSNALAFINVLFFVTPAAIGRQTHFHGESSSMSSLICHGVRFVLFCIFPILTFERSSDSWEGSSGCSAGDMNKLQVVLRG
jgi:hypothetical protein